MCSGNERKPIKSGGGDALRQAGSEGLNGQPYLCLGKEGRERPGPQVHPDIGIGGDRHKTRQVQVGGKYQGDFHNTNLAMNGGFKAEVHQPRA